MSKTIDNNIINNQKRKEVQELNIVVKKVRFYEENIFRFYNQDTDEINVELFMMYYLKTKCDKIDKINIYSKYIEIIQKQKVTLEIYNYKNLNTIIMYFLQKFVFFVEKFKLVPKLDLDMKKNNLDLAKVTQKSKELLVITNLLSLNNLSQKYSLEYYYASLLDEMNIYFKFIGEQSWNDTITYLTGFYAVNIEILLEIIKILDQIKSVSTIISEYFFDSPVTFSIRNFHDINQVYLKLNLYHEKQINLLFI